jgi:nitroimidazol reductase NimA-like FMN-containing flavoprotein (pyridoxamine 5'-phosphate oxidase superfamily)
MTDSGRQQELGRDEALRLLGSVHVGRVVFTHHALPAIRPVSYVVDGERIIFCSGQGSVITTAVNGAGTVVAFEADAVDQAGRIGWSVVIVGGAHVLTDAAEISRYRQVLPTAAGQSGEVIAVQADLVSGVRYPALSRPQPAGQLP